MQADTYTDYWVSITVSRIQKRLKQAPPKRQRLEPTTFTR